jgi:hypothetical protein
MKSDHLNTLLAFLERLEAAKIYYELASYRHEAVSVVIRVPGEYWEVDFLADGEIDVERFVSSGAIDGAAALDDLFARFSDPEPAVSHDTSRK